MCNVALSVSFSLTVHPNPNISQEHAPMSLPCPHYTHSPNGGRVSLESRSIFMTMAYTPHTCYQLLTLHVAQFSPILITHEA